MGRAADFLNLEADASFDFAEVVANTDLDLIVGDIYLSCYTVSFYCF